MNKTLKQLASRVRIVCSFGAWLDRDKQDEWQQKATGWHCTLRYEGRQYSFDFWQGQGVAGEPTVEGVLECLLNDAQAGQENFEEFCRELGYDQDSRRAEQIWKACRATERSMRRLLGEDYEAFLYAER